jgi:hypothetical protein
MRGLPERSWSDVLLLCERHPMRLTVAGMLSLAALLGCKSAGPTDAHLQRPAASCAAVGLSEGTGKSDDGWRRFPTTVETPSERSVHPLANASCEVAVTQLLACCPTLPEPEDLRLVLRTALHSVAAPEFEPYHQLLIDRGCTLLETLNGECKSIRRVMDLGVSNSDWERMSLVDRARVYSRQSRWITVDLARIKVGIGYSFVPPYTSGRIVSFSFYRSRGGVDFFNRCVKDAVPVVFVQLPIRVARGEAPFTFCFAFDSTFGEWYPFCTMVDHLDDGPVSNIRI